MFTLTDILRRQRFFSPEDGAGAALEGADTVAGGGDETPWWKALPEDAQAFAKAKGLDARKPDEALIHSITMAQNAEKKLGRPAESLIARPKEGQDITAWLAENREALGIPADAKGYEVAPPKDFPKEQWDGALADRAAALAHSLGIPKSAHEAYVSLMADRIRELDADAGEKLEQARVAMMTELESAWGDNTDTRVTAASQAAQRLAEEAGLGGEQLQAIAQVMAAKTGDANTLRLFDALARMMAEDSAVAIGKGKGGFSTTVEDAKQELETLRAPGGAYFEAVKAKNQAEVRRLQPQIDRLTATVAGKPGQ
jgi:hypothetical protein